MPQTKPQSGMRLGNYQLTVKLGQGIFSETWLAEHSFLEGKEICLKIFTNGRYCRNLGKQKYLNVIKDPTFLPHLEDYNPASTPPYIAQEIVAGRSLRQLLRERKKLNVQMAFTILEKTIKALQKLHEKNAAHLDLRPEHIIIQKNGHVQLLDYAIGKVTTLTIAEYYKDYTAKHLNLPKPLMRSLIYKSKRQRMGFEFDCSADIFALGILLFEMVTGNYPMRKAYLPSHHEESLPGKVDMIYSQCCGKAEAVYDDIVQILRTIKGDNATQHLSTLPGIRLLGKSAAITSIAMLGGGKRYVDGKNIALLSKNLDEIIASKLRFIALDFVDIDYLSSSAIGFLINFSDRLQGMGGAMVMFHVDKKVLTILGALGLEKVVHIMEKTEQVEKHLLHISKQPSATS